MHTLPTFKHYWKTWHMYIQTACIVNIPLVCAATPDISGQLLCCLWHRKCLTVQYNVQSVAVHLTIHKWLAVLVSEIGQAGRNLISCSTYSCSVSPLAVRRFNRGSMKQLSQVSNKRLRESRTNDMTCMKKTSIACIITSSDITFGMCAKWTTSKSTAVQ